MATEPPVIYRYEVPVDDRWHPIHACSTPVHVGCRDPRVVEFWAFHRPDLPPRDFRVYGTGQPIPEDAQYRGTAVAPGALVWHLLENRTAARPDNTTGA